MGRPAFSRSGEKAVAGMSATTHVIFLEHAHIYLVISTSLNHKVVITRTDMRIRLVAKAARLTNYSLVHDDDHYCLSDRQVTDCADRNRLSECRMAI
jgi:hypothetical protein